MTDHDLLRRAHERKAKAKGLTLYNHGWVVTDDAWLSEVGNGLILETKRLASGRYEHRHYEKYPKKYPDGYWWSA